MVFTPVRFSRLDCLRWLCASHQIKKTLISHLCDFYHTAFKENPRKAARAFALAFGIICFA